jgi:hypothetical protein
MKLKEVKIGDWMSVENEAYREYVYPDNWVYRIDNPVKVIIKRKPEGDSHRVVSKDADGNPISHYVRAGWLAIRWAGVDGSEAFDW